MACVEAMQFGLLPVVTAVGEMGQYVEPNVTGVILEPSKLEAGVDQIVALLKEPALFAEMRRNAMDIWRTAPLYSDDVCNACEALTARD